MVRVSVILKIIKAMRPIFKFPVNFTRTVGDSLASFGEHSFWFTLYVIFISQGRHAYSRVLPLSKTFDPH